MDPITTIPSLLTQRFLSGASITGISPIGVSYTFSYDNEADGPFQVGEGLTWATGTGTLLSLVDNGTDGSMSITLDSGALPEDNDTISGDDSSADCDIDGNVTLVSISDTEETIYRGRVRKISNLTDGGKIDLSSALTCGYRVQSVMANLPGITSLAFSLTDSDGDSVSCGSLTLSSGLGYVEFRNNGILIPPTTYFSISGGSDTLTANGQFTVVFAQGWISSGYEITSNKALFS